MNANPLRVVPDDLSDEAREIIEAGIGVETALTVDAIVKGAPIYRVERATWQGCIDGIPVGQPVEALTVDRALSILAARYDALPVRRYVEAERGEEWAVHPDAPTAEARRAALDALPPDATAAEIERALLGPGVTVPTDRKTIYLTAHGETLTAVPA